MSKKEYLPKSESGENTPGKFSAGCHKGNEVSIDTWIYFSIVILTGVPLQGSLLEQDQ